MAARKGPAYRMGTEHRDKIKNSNILSCLIEHVVGNREMTSTQVTAGLGLLKKVMPDMETLKLEGSGENGEIVQIVERRIVKADN